MNVQLILSAFEAEKKNRIHQNAVFSENKTEDRHFFWFKEWKPHDTPQAGNISLWFGRSVNFSLSGHANSPRARAREIFTLIFDAARNKRDSVRGRRRRRFFEIVQGSIRTRKRLPAQRPELGERKKRFGRRRIDLLPAPDLVRVQDREPARPSRNQLYLRRRTSRTDEVAIRRLDGRRSRA